MGALQRQVDAAFSESFASFLLPMLELDPLRRAAASTMLWHTHLADDPALKAALDAEGHAPPFRARVPPPAAKPIPLEAAPRDVAADAPAGACVDGAAAAAAAAGGHGGACAACAAHAALAVDISEATANGTATSGGVSMALLDAPHLPLGKVLQYVSQGPPGWGPIVAIYYY